jgi:Tfp pilus assembly protein PilN
MALTAIRNDLGAIKQQLGIMEQATTKVATELLEAQHRASEVRSVGGEAGEAADAAATPDDNPAAADAAERILLSWRGERRTHEHPTDRIWMIVIALIIITTIYGATNFYQSQAFTRENQQTRSVLLDTQSIGCRVLIAEGIPLYPDGPCLNPEVTERIRGG